MYRKCGAIVKAEATFKEILHPDSISWNSLLSTYVEQNRGEQAIRLCKQIQQQKSDIDEVTLICILQACSLMGGLETCRYIHFSVVSAGCDHNPSISVALVHGYGSCSSMLNAQAFFDELTEPNLVIWNAWLAGHASEGNHVSSLEVFELLQMNSLRADELTYTSLLSVCSHAGLVSTGLQCFFCMISNILTPDLRHFGALVDILGRAGDFKRAEDLVQGLPMPANSAIWLSLLGACRTHNNLQLAKEVFGNAVDASPNDAAAFVILSDIYALAG
jgi:pentatricopeptide repeat protein